jgi:hypothetical protein
MKTDAIREFVLLNCIHPARQAGTESVTVRAGVVHEDMRLVDAMPAVRGAIGTRKFQRESRVKLVKREEPTNGANLYFTFEILP